MNFTFENCRKFFIFELRFQAEEQVHLFTAWNVKHGRYAPNGKNYEENGIIVNWPKRWKKIGIKEFLLLFNQFSKEEQVKIAEKIALQTFADRWILVDKEMPDTDELTEEEVMAEIKAVRYGQKETP